MKVTAILEAFKNHNIVALGEPHGNEQAAAFRVALVRDPRFADVVDDIVVEAGVLVQREMESGRSLLTSV